MNVTTILNIGSITRDGQNVVVSLAGRADIPVLIDGRRTNRAAPLAVTMQLDGNLAEIATLGQLSVLSPVSVTIATALKAAPAVEEDPIARFRRVHFEMLALLAEVPHEIVDLDARVQLDGMIRALRDTCQSVMTAARS